MLIRAAFTVLQSPEAAMLVPTPITYAACALALSAPPVTAQSASNEAAPDHRIVRIPAPLPQQGWLGVSVEAGDGSALIVTDVSQGSAADRAGLGAGDRILSFEGRPIATYEELSAAVRGRPRGTRVRVTIERTVEVPLQAWEEDPSRVLLGVYLTDDVHIGSTMPDYGAEQAGLSAGDRIVAVAGERVHSKAEATAQVAAHEPGEKLSITIERNVEVRLGARPGPVQIPVDPLVREVPLERMVPPPSARPVPRASAAGAGLDELRAELRELATALRSLREEVDVLRDEVDRLRRGR
jgi:membrane-associated protease RseP (regulator of RpoE activity)